MTVWQTDDECVNVQTRVSLPTPSTSPHRTNSQSSKRSKRRSKSPPTKANLPSSILNGDKSSKRSSRISMEESLSFLDPRRFTPNLHANLVSEILALRRDQEEKTKLIESLEIALQTSREEQETLRENLAGSTKEARSLKRQLSLLEGGTSSTLGELARERDEAVDSVADARKRLDAAQKRIRSQEDDSQRIHDLWAQEKEDWEDERRKFERKLHVAETRLRTVLEEVEAFQASRLSVPHDGLDGLDGQEAEGEESGREHDAASVRTMSMTNSIRFTFTGGLGSTLTGNSLADELNFDDTDDQTDMDGGESILSSPRHKRNFSRDSVASKIHRRNCSMDSLKRTGSVKRGKIFINKPVLEVHEGESDDEEWRASTSPPRAVLPRPSYTDTGIQYSPPPSPETKPETAVTPGPPVAEEPLVSESSPCPEPAKEVSQGWKRLSRPAIIESLKAMQRMVSSAAQTTELPLTPPKTPVSPYTDSATSMDFLSSKMVTSSTQTEASPPKMLSRMTSATFPLTLSIPSINIEPPKSLPTSPTEDQRLPQYFKHFGCQVNMPVDVGTASVSSQTEAIQTDRRLALLPLHLQPSSVASRPPSPKPSIDLTAGGDLVSVTGRSHARSMMTHPDSLASPISLGGFDDDLHDDLSLDVMRTSSHKSGPLRPPHRLSSIQSGLYSGSSDEMDEFADADISDLEYRTALSAPRPPVAFPRHVKRNTSIKSPTSPEESRSGRSSAMTIRTELYSSYSLGDRQFKAGGGGKPARNVDKPLPSLPRSPSGASVRKAAMIQNGMASHRARSSSPSVADTIVPPFPIPARASSRPSISVSIPSEGQDSPGMGFWYRRDSVDRVPPRGQIRRARSSISLTRNPQYHRSSSRSPPISPSTETPLSPILQPLPAYDMSTSHFQEDDDSFRGHRPRLSNNTDITTNTELQSQAGSHQTPGVVEAIAQTMVGEWMFKYMRRRKSFGVIDNANKDENSNERHKRWVWLAPYERAILWSSKQPSSGSALMGKAGRKLIIQSVLDVKDDNPPPRGATLFNRSILILTPQRALKFTASTSERHYLWLTALSFLSHSSQPGTDMLSPTYLNPHQQALPSFNVPQGKTKRGGLKDTIRFTKSWRVQEKELPEIPAAASIPTAQLGEVAGYNFPDTPSAAPMGHSRESSRDAAEPPMIHRFHGRAPAPISTHGRKRSNTGGHMGGHMGPPVSFRGFAGALSPVSNHHSINSINDVGMMTAPSPDLFSPQGFANMAMAWGNGNNGASEAARQQGNFFDAIGTVRMEAFINPTAFSAFAEDPDEEEELRYAARRRSKESRRRNSRNRTRYHQDPLLRGRRGYNDSYGGRGSVGGDDVFFRNDPFGGF